MTKIMKNNGCLFGSLLFLQYVAEMVAYISSANFYSDADRLIPCAQDGDLAKPSGASALLDKPILMIGIFHLLSWLRTAVLFVVVCLGINLMQVWYLTLPVTIYGIVSYIIVAMTYFSPDGEACSAAQEHRGTYLLTEVCCCWAFLLLNLLPFVVLCMSKDSHDKNIRKADESDEEGDDEGDD